MTLCSRMFRAAALSGCAFFGAAVLAAEPAVKLISLQVSRPVVLDPFDMPGTRIHLEVSLEGSTVLGLGQDSAITILRDDTGHDLLAEGTARESEIEAEIEAAMSGLFGGGGTLTRKDTGGNIDHERAAGMIDPERGVVGVPVVTLGAPAKGATLLRLEGELALQVAAAGERRVRVDGVTASPDWFVIEVDVDGQAVRCNPDEYIDSDDGFITAYYCNQPKLLRAEVIGDAPPVPPGDHGRINLFVWGVAEDLSLEFVYPEEETVRVPIEMTLGVGL